MLFKRKSINDVLESKHQRERLYAVIDNVDLTPYYREELEKSPYIKPECYEQVMAHLLKQEDLTKTGNELTREEKEVLGFNPFLKVTHELVSVFTEEGLAQGDPRRVLLSIDSRATLNGHRIRALNMMKEAGVESVCVLAENNRHTCDWCKSQNGKIYSVDEDFNKWIEDNCKCEALCLLVFRPYIEGVDWVAKRARARMIARFVLLTVLALIVAAFWALWS